jgi:hypothetical protein
MAIKVERHGGKKGMEMNAEISRGNGGGHTGGQVHLAQVRSRGKLLPFWGMLQFLSL